MFLTDKFYFSLSTEPEHHLAVSGRTAEPGLGRQLQPHPEWRQGTPQSVSKFKSMSKAKSVAKVKSVANFESLPKVKSVSKVKSVLEAKYVCQRSNLCQRPNNYISKVKSVIIKDEIYFKS